MHQPRAPSSPPLPHHTDHHQEQTMHRSSSSAAATSPARPEEHSSDTMQHQAGLPGDNGVPTLSSLRQLAAAARVAGDSAPVPPDVLDQLITVALWPDVIGHDIPVGDRDIAESRS